MYAIGVILWLISLIMWLISIVHPISRENGLYIVPLVSMLIGNVLILLG